MLRIMLPVAAAYIEAYSHKSPIASSQLWNQTQCYQRQTGANALHVSQALIHYPGLLRAQMYASPRTDMQPMSGRSCLSSKPSEYISLHHVAELWGHSVQPKAETLRHTINHPHVQAHFVGYKHDAVLPSYTKTGGRGVFTNAQTRCVLLDAAVSLCAFDIINHCWHPRPCMPALQQATARKPYEAYTLESYGTSANILRVRRMASLHL